MTLAISDSVRGTTWCKFVAAAVMAALVPLVPVQAQTAQQTPENAKKFVELMLIKATIRPRDLESYQDYERYIPQSARASGPCHIAFIATHEFRVTGRADGERYPDQDLSIFFDTISDIQRWGDTIVFSTPHLPTGFVGSEMMIDLPSEDLATRVAFAMTFLKAHCNPADNRGF